MTARGHISFVLVLAVCLTLVCRAWIDAIYGTPKSVVTDVLDDRINYLESRIEYVEAVAPKVTVSNRIGMGVAYGGTKENHSILGLLQPHWNFPLKSTDLPGIYIDSKGEEVEFPADLILWEEPAEGDQ